MTKACVFAPSPLLTVTVEGIAGDGNDEIHIHAGGQGFWIARMLAELDTEVSVCGSFGGEVGRTAAVLMAEEDLDVRVVPTAGTNGAYIHDRRSGRRLPVAAMAATPLSRHEVDELYGAALVKGLDAAVCVLGGPGDPAILPADTYRRLATDLSANGAAVVADLSGQPLHAALEGGVTVVKVSHAELVGDKRAAGDDLASLVAAMGDLAAAGAGSVVVTRADDPTLALVDGRVLEVAGPRLEPCDTAGAGDSFTAGVAAGLAHGQSIDDALRLGAAAGAVNVTRRGLATGRRQEIEGMVSHIEVRPLPANQAAQKGGRTCMH